MLGKHNTIILIRLTIEYSRYRKFKIDIIWDNYINSNISNEKKICSINSKTG